MDGSEKLCGKIYLKTQGLMIFHCTLCEGKYDGFDKYAQHVESIHKSIICSIQDDPIDCFALQEDCSEKSFQEISIDPYMNDITSNGTLCETEFPMDKQNKKLIKTRKQGKYLKPTLAISKNNNANEVIKNKYSQIKHSKHIEFRPIRKKTNYFLTQNDVRPYVCDLCDANFKDPSSLSKHKARHSTEKIYPCPECNKKFYTQLDVKKHQKTHASERPFLCSICGKTLLSNEKLKDHMRRHTNQRDYECAVCKKCFYNSNLLSSHKLVHKKEKSFFCTFCDAKFTFKKGLKNHLKLHENKREYRCDLCEADFNQQAGLFCHKRTKHQIELSHTNYNNFV